MEKNITQILYNKLSIYKYNESKLIFSKKKKMSGYASSLHHHLLYDSRSRNQWRCDGFLERDGCLSGRNGIFGSDMARYRCRCCGFDIYAGVVSTTMEIGQQKS